MNFKVSHFAIRIVLLFLFLGMTVESSAQNPLFPKDKQLQKRINYLQRVPAEPLDEDSDIMKIGEESAEWMLFSVSFSTFALTNIALQDSSFKAEAVTSIEHAINKALDPKISEQYGIKKSLLDADSIGNHSVLYHGHLNLMLGCYRLLSDDPQFNALNDSISHSLYRRYMSTKYRQLESYPHQIWIPDNSVAIASLKMHSQNAGSNLDEACEKWLSYVKSHYIEPETKVLYSTVLPGTGSAYEEPRGSMLGWSIAFISKFDKEFAIELYENYKGKFSKRRLGFRMFKERHRENKTNLMGDIDSGPIIWGYSIPASAFALGGAIIAEDYKTAKKINRLIHFGSKSKRRRKEYRYKVRFVRMKISPMAEAHVLFSRTMVAWN